MTMSTSEGLSWNRIAVVLYLSIIILGVWLRFFNLAQPEKPVFDEVYFPKYAYSYVIDKPFYHTHPPLAKYTFQAGMHLYYSLPWVDDRDFGKVNFEKIPPIAYRWVNATLGSCLFILIALIAWRLSRSHIFTLLAMLFVATDGALIVASRFGLSNAHILFWGFLCMYLFIRALSSKMDGKYLWFLGVALGCVVCIKWNGLGYWLIVIAALIALALSKWLHFSEKGSNSTSENTTNDWFNPLTMMPALKWQPATKLLLALFVLPAIVYSLLWLPDRNVNTSEGIVGIHKKVWGYHSSTGAVGDHPYCSRWYTWPIMQRPISYEFQKVKYEVYGEQRTLYRSIHSFGNPVLYWIASAATLLLIAWLLFDTVVALIKRTIPPDFFVKGFIVLGYLATLLPWVFVSRCTFLYHYQTASVFSFLALAFCLTKLFRLGTYGRIVVALAVAAIVISFIYFLPFQIGLDMEKSSFYSKMWFQSWI